MKNSELNQFGVKELGIDQRRDTKGGWLLLIIIAAEIGYGIYEGYNE